MTKSKIFGRKDFWSESIQNILKRLSIRKPRNRKLFPLQFFSCEVVGIDVECLESYLKTKISKSKIFRCKIFILRLYHFLAQWQQTWKMAKPKIFGRNFFGSALFPNVLKRTLKRKTRSCKLFLVTEIFPWTLSFLG